MHWLKRLLLFGLVVLSLNSCGSSGQKGAEEKEVNIYIWSNYIMPETLDRFKKETGITAHVDTYDSNEALLEKMQSGVADYDIVVPSDYMVRILNLQGLLEPLDAKRLPNIKNLNARFRNLAFDPNNEHSIPYLWGTTGIGYNKKKVTDPVDSWGILWNPKYKDRILMLDDERECFGAALKWKGHSFNSKDPTELKEAENLLMQQKPLVKTYNSGSFDEILLSGDVWLAHGYSGQLAKIKDHNPDFAYIVPKEGGTLWVDNLAIPKGSRHQNQAYAFMNFCLNPQNAAEIANLSGYPSPNEAAKAFIKPEFLNDPARYPDEATLAKCELAADLGTTMKVVDEYWTIVKSH